MRDSVEAATSAYLPSLDGVRFLAFLMVFLMHTTPANTPLVTYGWVGVDLFFVISAFLFFHLFRIETEAVGHVSVQDFYLRRLLRIYPLMLAYPLLMILAGTIASDLLPLDWSTVPARFAGLALGIDNWIAWLHGWNTIPLSAHLWTLSFELQIYLVIPFAFMAYAAVGRQRFLAVLACLWIWSLGARAAVLSHPGGVYIPIYVTPALHPESVFAGLILAVLSKKRVPALLIAAVGLLAAVIVVSLPTIEVMSWWTMVTYPAAAIAAGSLVWLALRVAWLGAFFAAPPLRFLGKISYGLYVYHALGIAFASRGLKLAWLYGPLTLPTFAFAASVMMAVASYYLLERPFLRLKTRVSAISSRPL